LGIDHFDRLPDSLLLLVFNKIGDVKALGRCCVVLCCFHCLVPQVDNVVVRVDCVISDDDSSSSAINSSSISSSSDKSRNPFSNLFHFVFGGFVKPIQVISQFLCSKRPSGSSNGSSALLLSEDSEVERGGVTHHSPTQVLKNFNEIRFLKKKNLERKKNRGEEREKKNKEKGKKRKKKKEKKRKKINNDVSDLNYFLLFLNDHVSNFRLPRKQFITELTPRVKLITA
jgi:hypothetical protein